MEELLEESELAQAFRDVELLEAEHLCNRIVPSLGFEITLDPPRNGDCLLNCVPDDADNKPISDLRSDVVVEALHSKLSEIDKQLAKLDLVESDRQALETSRQKIIAESQEFDKPGVVLNEDHVIGIANRRGINISVSKYVASQCQYSAANPII